MKTFNGSHVFLFHIHPQPGHVASKLTCFTQLALLCGFAQEVFLNTYLLR